MIPDPVDPDRQRRKLGSRLLAHIARSGDVPRGLAEGVVSGVHATGYASDEARNAAIGAGADRRAPELLLGATSAALS